MLRECHGVLLLSLYEFLLATWRGVDFYAVDVAKTSRFFSKGKEEKFHLLHLLCMCLSSTAVTYINIRPKN